LNSLLIVETLAIGDELLTGKIADSNSAFVGGALFENGFRLSRQNVIPDEKKAIQSAIGELAARAHVVVCFGGLGPTSDDITAAVVAELIQKPLVEDPASRERLIAYLNSRQRSLTEQTLKQVRVPEGSEVIPNFVGAAPGFRISLGQCQFFFLPGVPDEMKPMFHHSVMSVIKRNSPVSGEVESCVWRCIGIVESEVQRLMDPIESSLPDGMWLGYRTRFPENYLYLYCHAPDPQKRKSLIEKWKPEIESRLEPFCYGREDRDLETWVLDLLKSKKKNIVCAESCTGGLVVQRLTQISGASDWVWGGFVTYQIAAKQDMLGIRLNQSTDAVSQQCSVQLAQAALAKSGCDIALGITGYMGPTGGTADEPLGTVWIAVANREGKLLTERIGLPPRSRALLQWGAASFALNAVRKFLK